MIKISSFSSDINRKIVLSERSREFISSIERDLGQSLVVSDIGDYDADLKLIFIASGGSEGKFLKAFKDLQAPYYLLTSGTDNSLAASLEIMTYLNLHGLEGEILHGSSGYIASRIKAILDNLRKNPLENLAGTKVIESRDYLNDISVDSATGAKKPTGLPKSNVLYYVLENDQWCCVRPSGTEPKIKFYFGIRGKSMEDAKALYELFDKEIRKLGE